jgi:tetratricopeptide (TPR) repeat protein
MGSRSLFFFIIFSISLYNQLNASVPIHFIDTIELKINQTKGEKQKIELLLKAEKNLESLDPDKALKFAFRALDLTDVNKYPEQRLQAMIDVGRIRSVKTEFAPGMEMALRAKELAARLDNKQVLGEANLIIGMIRIFQGNFAGSYESHFMALRLFEQINYKEGVVKALNGIGNICYYQGNFLKANIYYSNALKIARELHDTLQIANVLNNIGLVLVEQGQMQKGIDCYLEASIINFKMGQEIRLATNYINLATTYLKLDRIDDFFINYNKAISIYSSFRSHHSLALCYLTLSDYYKLINNSSDEIRYARMAFFEGSTYKLHDVVFQASSVLEHFYYTDGKIDSAYKYAMIGNEEKDSIDIEHSSAKLTLLEMEYTFDKKQKENSLRQQRKDFITIILIILAISGLITTILALSRQIVKTKNIRLEKQRLSDEVEYKNKELAINVMNLLKKNEFLVDHTNRLIEIQQKATDESIKKDILYLINSLQRGSGEEIWDEFELRFKQVHSGFYEKLLFTYPDLTSNELKLCALLRLNLSTKEICELTGQRPGSLDVARSRLRKKLEITNSQTNLITFLSHF